VSLLGLSDNCTFPNFRCLIVPIYLLYLSDSFYARICQLIVPGYSFYRPFLSIFRTCQSIVPGYSLYRPHLPAYRTCLFIVSIPFFAAVLYLPVCCIDSFLWPFRTCLFIILIRFFSTKYGGSRSNQVLDDRTL
jgi:hypothetical protein